MTEEIIKKSCCEASIGRNECVCAPEDKKFISILLENILTHVATIKEVVDSPDSECEYDMRYKISRIASDLYILSCYMQAEKLEGPELEDTEMELTIVS